MGIGIITVSSISKIKKITVKIKNRRDRLVRILCSGSNPHSNADFFSFIRIGVLIFARRNRMSITKIIITHTILA